MDIRTQCLIIGSGAAGCTAGIYTSRAGIRNILLTGHTVGGQLSETTDVENFPGFVKIKGLELMNQMKEHAMHYGTEVVEDGLTDVDFSKRPFVCKGERSTYTADTVVIATGAQAKWLGLESEKTYKGFGVSGCAVCDGPFYKGRVVSVIGGGNTAVTEALYLANLASKVNLIYRGDALKCEKILQKRLVEKENIEVLFNRQPVEIMGSQDALGKFVTGIRLEDTVTGGVEEIKTDGVFIAIGHRPSTDLFAGKLELDGAGYIKTNGVKTSVEGIFAAGDVCNPFYKQSVVAAGDGCKAALEVERFLS